MFSHQQGEGPTLILAHSAGLDSGSPWMEAMSTLLVERGLRVCRFNFPYMQRRLNEGGRRPPDPQPVLLECWREVIAAAPRPLMIGGKSMGGRMATLVADEQQVAGVVCYGYPFHPPGKPEKLRTAHLQEATTPVLICQGERDTFGTPNEVEGYRLSPQIELFWLADGDHSLKPRKRSGRTLQQNLEQAADRTAVFVKRAVRLQSGRNLQS